MDTPTPQIVAMSMCRQHVVRARSDGRNIELAVYREDGAWGQVVRVERADARAIAEWILKHTAETSPGAT